jgi:hypothetical protein
VCLSDVHGKNPNREIAIAGVASGFWGKGEIERGGAAGGDSDFLRLRAEGFVPGGDGVFTRREIGEAEDAVFTSDREMGGLQDNEIALHPGMNIAFHRNDFRFVVGVGKGRSLGRLDAAPVAIRFCGGMNVVGDRVNVDDLDFLSDADGENVGSVAAAALLEEYGAGGRRRGVGLAGGNIDDDIGEAVAAAGDDEFIEQGIGGMELGAGGILGEIERSAFGWSALEGDDAGECAVFGPSAEMGGKKKERGTREKHSGGRHPQVGSIEKSDCRNGQGPGLVLTG